MGVPRVQVLVSTMNQESVKPILCSMNIERNVVIINQITDSGIETHDVIDELDHITFRSFKEKGLSLSRNRAILESAADICVVADDDMTYVDEYEDIIIKAYEKYSDADIIAFFVDSEESSLFKIPLREGRLGLLMSMKLRSVQITFKRERLSAAGLHFNENFGAGTKNYMGEENILLANAIHANLKVYSVPIKIATLIKSESTWFNGFNEQYFTVRGKVFRMISIFLAPILIVRFAVVKKHMYHNELSIFRAMLYMFKGYLSKD